MRIKILGLLALAAVVGLFGLATNATRVSATPGAFAGVPATLAVGATSGTITVTYIDEVPANTAGVLTVAPAVASTGAAVLVTCTASANGGAVTFVPGSTTCSVAEDTEPVPPPPAPPVPEVSETITISFSVLCTAAGNVTLTLTHGTAITATIGCGATVTPPIVGSATCPLSPSVNDVRVCKVNQNGTPQSVAFALIGPLGTIEMVTSSTSTNPAGTCSTSQSCSRLLTSNLGFGSPGTLGPLTLTAGVYSLREITASSSSIQIDIRNGLGEIMPPGQPVNVTVPCASAAACTFLFTNSQPLPGAGVAAGSSVVAVIGGSSFGLTNRTNIEIAPAPGSDDDARLDIRVRDSNNIPLTGAHVIVMTDKGRLAMRQDIAQTPAITGYDVIEPASPNFGRNDSGDHCDVGIGVSLALPASGTYAYPFRTGSEQIADGFTNDSGIVSACLFVSDDMVPGITPGKANITVIIENQGNFGPGSFGFYANANLVLTTSVTVVGPPASVKVAASPTNVQCGEKATITATITDSVGQNVSDHTRVELVSNFGATIGGTGSTLGYPGQGVVNPISSSAAETFSGVATAFLLTSTEHVGPYEVVIATGGSTGGGFQPGGSVGVSPNSFTTFGLNSQNVVTGIFDPARGFIPSTAQGNITGALYPFVQNPQVFGGSGVFSTAPVSAQVTVTCSLPVIAVPVAPAAAAPIRAPITGEGIRPPNTGDAGLASDNGSSTLFIVGGLMFALAGVATLKVARR